MSKFSGSVIVYVEDYCTTGYKHESLILIGEHPEIEKIISFDYEIWPEFQDYLIELIPSAILDLGFVPFELINGYYHVYFSGFLELDHDWDGTPDGRVVVEDINFYFLSEIAGISV